MLLAATSVTTYLFFLVSETQIPAMADSESFVRCFSSFVARLDDRLPEVEQHFGGECSEEDMFSYFWGLQEAHKCLVLSVPETLKSESSAVTYRTRGNKLYRSKNLKEALKSFNFSIMFAPHPPVPSAAASLCEEPAADGTSAAFEALALAYANRSAVMFELHQYEECLKDVELAILHGYPEASRCKLLARKERCVAKRKEEGGAVERLLTTHKHCPAVATADPATPRKSDAIRLSHTPEKGRHFLANREILPGTYCAYSCFSCALSMLSVTIGQSLGDSLQRERLKDTERNRRRGVADKKRFV